LLNHGARIDARNEDENTPLHLAAKNGRIRYNAQRMSIYTLCLQFIVCFLLSGSFIKGLSVLNSFKQGFWWANFLRGLLVTKGDSSLGQCREHT